MWHSYCYSSLSGSSTQFQLESTYTQSLIDSTLHSITMFTSVLRRVLPAQAGPSTRACSTSAGCSHAPRALLRPTASPTRTSALTPTSATPSAAVMPLARNLSQWVSRISQSDPVSRSLVGQVRGMKVRSSVKKFCDGCSVVRR
jgi:large subunit ribosomal protein L36